MKKIIHTSNAPAAVGPYSQGILAGDTLYISGQIPLNKDGEICTGTIEEQTSQILKNIDAILTEAGMSREDVVKTTCFLTNLEDFVVFNEIYSQYFISKPARSTVEVSRLPKGVLCEIETIAVKIK